MNKSAGPIAGVWIPYQMDHSANHCRSQMRNSPRMGYPYPVAWNLIFPMNSPGWFQIYCIFNHSWDDDTAAVFTHFAMLGATTNRNCSYFHRMISWLRLLKKNIILVALQRTESHFWRTSYPQWNWHSYGTCINMTHLVWWFTYHSTPQIESLDTWLMGDRLHLPGITFLFRRYYVPRSKVGIEILGNGDQSIFIGFLDSLGWMTRNHIPSSDPWRTYGG